jgi:hypothetical protein
MRFYDQMTKDRERVLDPELYGRWEPTGRCQVRQVATPHEQCPNPVEFVIRYPDSELINEHSAVCGQCLTSALRAVTRQGSVVVERAKP